MVKVGCKYEETKSMLVKKLNNPNSIEIMVTGDIATRHACYFCEKKIPKGEKMFKLVHYCLNSRVGIDKEKYFVDENCMKSIITKK